MRCPLDCRDDDCSFFSKILEIYTLIMYLKCYIEGVKIIYLIKEFMINIFKLI